MDKQVVAIMKSLDQKEAVLRELEIKGVKEEDIQIIHRDDEDAKFFTKHFKQGDYLVIVESEKDIGHIPVEQEETLSQQRTPKGHHHHPHHQMKQGL
ncbi:hypothetical protein [Salipaludibacillus aurantiacus]|uniref:Heat induced stress protein YflT n=1 Tax=Salipaludibacillus aurantiacus TaxID=1601833 RepID=A0A1H9TU14_9BACI|nr:hypothetical protein [Salipaludibacillus aurantiacus]SES00860.1 hypothetical protein SAMN05518684_10698 [Salipaludibacillus aurantiacus]